MTILRGYDAWKLSDPYSEREERAEREEREEALEDNVDELLEAKQDRD